MESHLSVKHPAPPDAFNTDNKVTPPLSLNTGKGRGVFRLAVAVPFFLAAALHLSLMFIALSAQPLIYAHLRFGRIVALLCCATNLALVWLLSGRMNAAVFFILAIVPAFTIAECLHLKVKLEWNAVCAAAMILLATAFMFLSYSYRFHLNPIQKLDSFVGSMVEQVAENIEKVKGTSAISSQDLDKFLLDPETTKKNILYELPSALTIAAVLLVVANLLLLIRLNIQGVREKLGLESSFFKTWKAPDHTVWPTLAAGFLLIIDVPVVSEVALNVFKVLIAIYAIQGLSITNFLFDVWGVKGFLRPLGYILAVAVLLPLVISLGFFDLWFNFRSKIKT